MSFFIREDLVAKSRFWALANRVLAWGSEVMLRQFGEKGCGRIAIISFVGIFVWAVTGVVGILIFSVHKTLTLSSLGMAFASLVVFGLGLAVILAVFIMAVQNCPDEEAKNS